MLYLRPEFVDAENAFPVILAKRHQASRASLLRVIRTQILWAWRPTMLVRCKTYSRGTSNQISNLRTLRSGGKSRYYSTSSQWATASMTLTPYVCGVFDGAVSAPRPHRDVGTTGNVGKSTPMHDSKYWLRRRINRKYDGLVSDDARLWRIATGTLEMEKSSSISGDVTDGIRAVRRYTLWGSTFQR